MEISSNRRLYDLKEEAANFYQKNRVPERLEDVLNSLFYEKPNDVYGMLVSIVRKMLSAVSSS